MSAPVRPFDDGGVHLEAIREAEGAPGSALMRAGSSEQLAPERRRLPMQLADVDDVLAIESAAYEFPWTRGNFVDSLVAGYEAWLLRDAQGALLGYCIAMAGVDEMHLLNLTVAPREQGRGHARWLLDALVDHCRTHAAPMLWLEVRSANDRARALYRRYGFREIGVRRSYYPAPRGRREDAVVMSLAAGSDGATPAETTPLELHRLDAPSVGDDGGRRALD